MSSARSAKPVTHSVVRGVRHVRSLWTLRPRTLRRRRPAETRRWLHPLATLPRLVCQIAGCTNEPHDRYYVNAECAETGVRFVMTFLACEDHAPAEMPDGE